MVRNSYHTGVGLAENLDKETQRAKSWPSQENVLSPADMSNLVGRQVHPGRQEGRNGKFPLGDTVS